MSGQGSPKVEFTGWHDYRMVATDKAGAVVDAGQGGIYHVAGMAAVIIDRSLTRDEPVYVTVEPVVPGAGEISSPLWRDLGGAPKDGTMVLLLTADCGVVQGYWDPDAKDFYYNEPESACYDPTRPLGCWMAQHPIDRENGDKRLFCGMTPKAWMPIPRYIDANGNCGMCHAWVAEGDEPHRSWCPHGTEAR